MVLSAGIRRLFGFLILFLMSPLSFLWKLDSMSLELMRHTKKLASIVYCSVFSNLSYCNRFFLQLLDDCFTWSLKLRVANK